MALVKFGAGISEMRGKEGGIVYSRNAYGAYQKTKVSPVNPQSEYQQQVRGNLQEISQNWNGLSEAQKTGWDDLGAVATRVNVFGDTTNYTGFGIFMRLNLNLFAIGQSLLSAAPSIPTLPNLQVSDVAITVAGGTMEISFTPTPLGSGYYLWVAATPNINSGRSFVKNLRRQISAISNPSTGTDVWDDWANRFGTLTAGGYIHFGCKIVDSATGFDTPIQVFKADVAS